MIRDCTDSDKVNKLSAHAERFFYRLMMKADDYGLYFADTRLLKAHLFPLQMEETQEADISIWLNECKAQGLINVYSQSGKNYLHILNFGQRLRTAKKRFPDPPKGDVQPSVSDMSADRGGSRLEVEEKRKIEVEEKPKELAGFDFCFDSIKKLFGFESEIKHAQKWFRIAGFLKTFQDPQNFSHFCDQLKYYILYKTEAKEKIHSFEAFVDGAWDGENWEHKLNTFRKKAVKDDKSAPAVFIKRHTPAPLNQDDADFIKRFYSDKSKGPAESKSGGLGSEIRKRVEQIKPTGT